MEMHIGRNADLWEHVSVLFETCFLQENDISVRHPTEVKIVCDASWE